jgi:hypothetical protein
MRCIGDVEQVELRARHSVRCGKRCNDLGTPLSGWRQQAMKTKPVKTRRSSAPTLELI